MLASSRTSSASGSDEVGAGASERAREHLSEAAARAGDDRDAAVEREGRTGRGHGRRMTFIS
jgi:hypothetical protein